MRIKSFACLLVSVCIAIPSAFAADLGHANIRPGVIVSWAFSNALLKDGQFKIAAGLGLDHSACNCVSQRADAGMFLEKAGEGSGSLNVLELSGNRGGLIRATVLGHPLSTGPARLDEVTGGQPTTGSNWLWWTLGGIVLAGGAIAAAGSGHHDNTVQGSSGNSGVVCGNNDVLIGNTCVAPTGGH